jgi:D-arabinose 1-dehydrogenase-like Zn-dependent alcohol dehydrogenase
VKTKSVEFPGGRRQFFIAAAVGVAAAALLDVRAQGSEPKIAIIGAGREAGSLGTLFAKNGFQVMFSSRNPEQLKVLVATQSRELSPTQ